MSAASLYAWQPKGHGSRSFFVCAESEEAARAFVETEIARRKAISWEDDDSIDRLTDGDVSGWGSDYYELTVAQIGSVVLNDND